MVMLLNLEGGKRYAHTASCGYKITMAMLQPDDRRQPNCACEKVKIDPKGRVILIAEHNLKEHIMCVLDLEKEQQCKLNLVIQPGEQIAFRTIGRIPVLLTAHENN